MSINAVNGPAAPLAGAANPYIVDKAYDNVVQLSRGDANQAQMREAANILAGLSARDADAVIDKLAANGQLEHFIKEITDGGGFAGRNDSGLSKDEQMTFYSNLAKQLDGGSLATVSKIYGERDKGAARVASLSEAIANHSSADTKEAFVKGMVANSNTNNVGKLNKQDALAIATVIGSYGPGSKFADGAWQSLSGEQQKSVVNATINTKPVNGQYDLTVFNKLGDVIGASKNADVKATFVDAAGLLLEKVTDSMPGQNPTGTFAAAAKNQAIKTVRNQITSIIQTDVEGVVRELRKSEETGQGKGVASYAKSMVKSGKEGTEQLGKFMNVLRAGENGKLDNKDELKARMSDKDLLLDMGYFAATVSAGINDLNLDKQQERDAIKSILGGLSSFDPSGTSSFLSEIVINPLLDMAYQDNKDFGLALLETCFVYEPEKAKDGSSLGNNQANKPDELVALIAYYNSMVQRAKL
jgi:hypothetical protein